MSNEAAIAVIGAVTVTPLSSYIIYLLWRGPVAPTTCSPARDAWLDALVTHAAVFDSLPQSVQDGLRPDLAEARRLRQSIGVTGQEAAEGLALVRPMFLPTISAADLVRPPVAGLSWITQEKARL